MHLLCWEGEVNFEGDRHTVARACYFFFLEGECSERDILQLHQIHIIQLVINICA